LAIAVFLKYTEDPFVLETVQDLIKALCQRKECLGPLQEKFIPTIVSILGLSGAASTEKQDIALDVLNTIVRYTEPPLSNSLLETAFPAIINSEMTAAGQVGRLVITIITKMGSMLGQNVDMLLKAVISKMQNLECLKVIMNLVLIFAHLFLTQMDAVLNFLSTVPGPNGEPAMQFVLTNWLSRQNSFFGNYERKVSITYIPYLLL